MSKLAVIGLDLSITETGISSPRGERVVKTSPKTGTLEKRMDVILEEIANEWWELSDPVAWVIEAPAFAARGNALYQVWGLQAVARHWIAEGLYEPFHLVAPNTLKKFATGSGRATKKDMVDAARLHHGYPGKNHNEADALHLRHFGISNGWGV